MTMKVYVDDVEDTTAINIVAIPLMNAISFASFDIPNVHIDGDNTLRNTWDARKDIAIIKITGDDDYILFLGQIKRITGDRKLTLHRSRSD